MLNPDSHVLVHALAGSVTARERRLLKENPWGTYLPGAALAALEKPAERAPMASAESKTQG